MQLYILVMCYVEFTLMAASKYLLPFMRYFQMQKYHLNRYDIIYMYWHSEPNEYGCDSVVINTK